MADFINFGEEFETNGFSLIEDGEYEVYILRVEPAVTKTGKQVLKVRFKFRDDVEQSAKNREITYSIFKKEGDNCYDFNKINKIILTQKNTSNYKTSFGDFDEVLQYLHGLNLRITVETVYSESLGKDANQVKDWSFAPSNVEPSDDAVDLPF